MAGATVISARRQWLFLFLGTVGLAGSLVVAQLILERRGWRIDLTPSKRYELSDHTRRVLEKAFNPEWADRYIEELLFDDPLPLQ